MSEDSSQTVWELLLHFLLSWSIRELHSLWSPAIFHTGRVIWWIFRLCIYEV